MADAEFKLRGVEGVIDNLSELESKVQKKVARSALRKAANVWRANARSNAKRLDDPQTPSSIPKNIITQTANKLGKQNNGVAMRVGVLGGAKAPADPSAPEGGKGNPGGRTFYWRFLEFGTQDSPARPFLRPAMDVNAATNKFASSLWDGIKKVRLK